MVVATISLSLAFFSRYFPLWRITDTGESARNGTISRSYISFKDSFFHNDLLEETGDPAESDNEFWWLDSGARFFVSDGVGRTLAGNLSESSPWRERYRRSNSEDTDGGVRPQNIFRLFTRIPFHNVQEEAYFRMRAYDMDTSPNRNTSNGFSLISRYQDADNFYYGGIRVDGSAVIKKKVNGTYYELAHINSFLSGQNANEAMKLIARGVSIGIRFETVNTENGQVELRLSVHVPKESSNQHATAGEWRDILVALDNKDNNTSSGAFVGSGLLGIRTDFMDAEIANYHAAEYGCDLSHLY